MASDREKAVVGCLLGTAVGDAIWLCSEGLTKRRQQRLFPKIDRYHLLFGRGMVSDDTEHTCMVAQALIASGGEVDAFRRHLAWQLCLWQEGLWEWPRTVAWMERLGKRLAAAPASSAGVGNLRTKLYLSGCSSEPWSAQGLAALWIDSTNDRAGIAR